MIGTIVAQSSAGYLLKVTDDNWPLVFYACGAITLVWYALWHFTVYSSPSEHPTITEYELNYLEHHLKGVNKNKVSGVAEVFAKGIPGDGRGGGR